MRAWLSFSSSHVWVPCSGHLQETSVPPKTANEMKLTFRNKSLINEMTIMAMTHHSLARSSGSTTPTTTTCWTARSWWRRCSTSTRITWHTCRRRRASSSGSRRPPTTPTTTAGCWPPSQVGPQTEREPSPVHRVAPLMSTFVGFRPYYWLSYVPADGCRWELYYFCKALVASAEIAKRQMDSRAPRLCCAAALEGVYSSINRWRWHLTPALLCCTAAQGSIAWHTRLGDRLGPGKGASQVPTLPYFLWNWC